MRTQGQAASLELPTQLGGSFTEESLVPGKLSRARSAWKEASCKFQEFSEPVNFPTPPREEDFPSEGRKETEGDRVTDPIGDQGCGCR